MMTPASEIKLERINAGRRGNVWVKTATPTWVPIESMGMINPTEGQAWLTQAKKRVSVSGDCTGSSEVVTFQQGRMWAG